MKELYYGDIKIHEADATKYTVQDWLDEWKAYLLEDKGRLPFWLKFVFNISLTKPIDYGKLWARSNSWDRRIQYTKVEEANYNLF